MFEPSAEFHRFGILVKTNAYSMRSDEFSPQKERDEVRILVIGDSVPNGGSLTDQKELATELLKHSLEESLPQPVVVGNISAGTWSPPNFLAYIEEYGTFDADVAFIVLNKGDAFDFSTFEPLNPNTHPTEKPHSALVELFSRYGIPRLKRAFNRSNQPPVPEGITNRKSCLPTLGTLLDLFQQQQIPAFLLYSPSEHEILADGSFVPQGGYPQILEFSEMRGIQLYSMAQAYGEFVTEGGRPWRDDYHPNPLGQGLMAQKFQEILESQGLVQKWNQVR
jgi:hypothetical protein